MKAQLDSAWRFVVLIVLGLFFIPILFSGLIFFALLEAGDFVLKAWFNRSWLHPDVWP